MIDSRHIRKYPIRGVADALFNRVEQFIGSVTKSANYNKQKTAMFAAYLDSQDRVISELKDIKRNDLIGFGAFLIKECRFKLSKAQAWISSVVAILHEACGIFEYERYALTVVECEIVYKATRMNADKLTYYRGWYFTSKDGCKGFINLILFYERFGAGCTAQFYKSISVYLGRYKFESAKVPLVDVQLFFTMVANAFRNKHELGLLWRAKELNAFFEENFEVQREPVLERGESDEGFHIKWTRMVGVVTRSLIRDSVLPKPEYPLYAPKFKSPAVGKPRKKIKFLTNIDGLVAPLTKLNSSGQSATVLLDNISTDIEVVKTICETVRSEIMIKHWRRISLAKVDNIIPMGTNHACFADMCATWERYNFKRGISMFDGLNSPRSELEEELGILTSTTLLSLLCLFVIEHPAATPSWLLTVKLFDDQGRPCSYETTNDVLIGFKYRRGKRLAQLGIKLTKRSKAIVDDIVALTEQARSHLADLCDNSYKYLLLASSRTHTSPGKINRIYGIGDEAYCNSTLANRFLSSEDGAALLTRLTLTTLRSNCGVRVYLHTKSVREMAWALGHAEYDPKLIERYLPAPIHEYFLAKWIRQFQNGLIYHAMKDSAYLFEAMNMSNIHDIELFLKEYTLDTTMFSARDAESFAKQPKGEFDSSRLNIVINPLTAKVFLSFHQAWIKSEADGVELNPSFYELSELSLFVTTAKSLLEEAADFDLAEDVTSTLLSAKPSQQLVDDLYRIISHG